MITVWSAIDVFIRSFVRSFIHSFADSFIRSSPPAHRVPMYRGSCSGNSPLASGITATPHPRDEARRAKGSTASVAVG